MGIHSLLHRQPRVGMANIWMFPYRIGEFGGSAFLIPYIIFVLLIGFSGVIGEMAFGRAMHSGPLGAFKKAFLIKKSRLGSFIGVIPVIGSLGIAIGYSVIIGWILKYLADSVTGNIMSSREPAEVFAALLAEFRQHSLASGRPGSCARLYVLRDFPGD